MESERLLALTDEAWKMVSMEIIRSRQLHPPMIDHFHAYGVIKEELEEFFDSIKKQKPDLSEIAQVVGCCIMTLQDTHNYRETKIGYFEFEEFVGTFSFKKLSSYHQVYAYLRLHFDKYWENVKNTDILQIDTETSLVNMIDFGVSGLIFALDNTKGK